MDPESRYCPFLSIWESSIPANGCLGRVEGFELHHRAGQPFHKPVILFNDIVQIFTLVNRDF